MRTLILMYSILSILFGILVFKYPEILNYLVASFFILVGILGIIFYIRLKEFKF